MASAVPDEIGNPFDWSELYWGGFKPSTIGAVPLIDAHSTEDAVINSILDVTRKTLETRIESDELYTKNGVKMMHYFVTIHDEYEKYEEPNITENETNNEDHVGIADDQKEVNDEEIKNNEPDLGDKMAENDKQQSGDTNSNVVNGDVCDVNESNNADDLKTNVDQSDTESHADDAVKSVSNSKPNNEHKRRLLTICRLWHQNVFIGVRGTGGSDPGRFNFMGTFDAKTGALISFTKWTD